MRGDGAARLDVGPLGSSDLVLRDAASPRARGRGPSSSERGGWPGQRLGDAPAEFQPTLALHGPPGLPKASAPATRRPPLRGGNPALGDAGGWPGQRLGDAPGAWGVRDDASGCISSSSRSVSPRSRRGMMGSGMLLHHPAIEADDVRLAAEAVHDAIRAEWIVLFGGRGKDGGHAKARRIAK